MRFSLFSTPSERTERPYSLYYGNQGMDEVYTWYVIALTVTFKKRIKKSYTGLCILHFFWLISA